MSFLFYIHYLVYNIPLFFFSKTKIFPVIAFCALVAGIIFNLIFIDHLGIWSVCLSLYIIRLVQGLVAYIYIRYYKFHSLVYVKHPEALAATFIIIIVFNVLLFLHFEYHISSIEIINLSPLLVFIIAAPFLYRSEVVFLSQKLFKIRI